MAAKKSHHDFLAAEIAKYQPFMTRKDIAAFFGVSTRTVRNWEDDGKFPKAVRKVGRELRWMRHTVLDLALSDAFDLKPE
jgi:predicted DNA-binding transcriptional regulator AlpA